MILVLLSPLCPSSSHPWTPQTINISHSSLFRSPPPLALPRFLRSVAKSLHPLWNYQDFCTDDSQSAPIFIQLTTTDKERRYANSTPTFQFLPWHTRVVSGYAQHLTQFGFFFPRLFCSAGYLLVCFGLFWSNCFLVDCNPALSHSDPSVTDARCLRACLFARKINFWPKVFWILPACTEMLYSDFVHHCNASSLVLWCCDHCTLHANESFLRAADFVSNQALRAFIYSEWWSHLS